MKRTLFALVVAVYVGGIHGQQLPTQFTVMEWVDNSDTALQTCLAQSTDVGDDHAILGGRIYVEDDSYDRESRPEAVYLSYTDHTGTHRDQITLHDRYDDEFHGSEWLTSLGIYPDWYIDVGDLSHTIEADSVKVEVVSPAQTAIWHDEGAVVDLVYLQWLNHWCVDEDSDNYCDLFDAGEGELHLPIPPMRAAEQTELADCLDSHRNTKVVVAKADYQISGTMNFPALAQWTADCPAVSQTVVPTPEKIEPLSRVESCRLFNSWMLGQQHPVPEYLCNSRLNPEDSALSGSQIRYRMDKAIGEFPGFNCPVAGSTSTARLTANDLRFDNLPLNRTLSGVLGAPGRQVKLRMKPNGR